ncbi:MAG: nickel pincer cofactor biosynthesis protein LarB [Granulosicoccus sp.]
MNDTVRFDWERTGRTGIPEVVFAQGKTASQLVSIASSAIDSGQHVLMTRVDAEKAAELVRQFDAQISWHEPSATITVGTGKGGEDVSESSQVAIVAAGTSDHALVEEVAQCLTFLGVQSSSYIDVGVAGLWRLTSLAEELNEYPLLIAVAGMEGALFSVLAGLVKGPVIAVPSSVGYGVSCGGHVALNCALSSCAPGIAVVNIDNGFGAAALAVKMLKMHSPVAHAGT